MVIAHQYPYFCISVTLAKLPVPRNEPESRCEFCSFLMEVSFLNGSCGDHENAPPLVVYPRQEILLATIPNLQKAHIVHREPMLIYGSSLYKIIPDIGRLLKHQVVMTEPYSK